MGDGNRTYEDSVRDGQYLNDFTPTNTYGPRARTNREGISTIRTDFANACSAGSSTITSARPKTFTFSRSRVRGRTSVLLPMINEAQTNEAPEHNPSSTETKIKKRRSIFFWGKQTKVVERPKFQLHAPIQPLSTLSMEFPPGTSESAANAGNGNRAEPGEGPSKGYIEARTRSPGLTSPPAAVARLESRYQTNFQRRAPIQTMWTKVDAHQSQSTTNVSTREEQYWRSSPSTARDQQDSHMPPLVPIRSRRRRSAAIGQSVTRNNDSAAVSEPRTVDLSVKTPKGQPRVQAVIEDIARIFRENTKRVATQPTVGGVANLFNSLNTPSDRRDTMLEGSNNEPNSNPETNRREETARGSGEAIGPNPLSSAANS
ncbi:hypothetical protein K469DRAFT_691612 [Zopfia rhizophila CBS 207.26]|uniref:Uncharacterized protein n=1 Tax=Zopfia rhizophila CBS 207.26 TaxID=1314779 RepID=A0A6A6DQZ0_9PEZI|nr:hypothetical protein K469DRAFT_691612 [Zopfia rhizophila CBS 207.26]